MRDEKATLACLKSGVRARQGLDRDWTGTGQGKHLVHSSAFRGELSASGGGVIPSQSIIGHLALASFSTGTTSLIEHRQALNHNDNSEVQYQVSRVPRRCPYFVMRFIVQSILRSYIPLIAYLHFFFWEAHCLDLFLLVSCG